MEFLNDCRARLKNEGAITLSLRVRPHAAQTQFVSLMDDGSIKLDLAAPAEDGKANEALVRFMAETFDVPLSHVEVLRGQSNRQKTIRISAIA